MPTIIRLNQCRITMYFLDHLPPHFHIIANDGSEAQIEIATLAVLAGGVSPGTMAEALEWAGANRRRLEEEWNRLNP